MTELLPRWVREEPEEQDDVLYLFNTSLTEADLFKRFDDECVRYRYIEDIMSDPINQICGWNVGFTMPLEDVGHAIRSFDPFPRKPSR